MDTLNPIEVPKAISEHGFMVVTCGFYLAVTFAVMIYIVKRVTKSLDVLVDLQKTIFNMTKDIRDGVNRNVLDQVHAVAAYSFDYSRLEVLKAINRIVIENNIEDRAVVEQKVDKILKNLQAVRVNRMSNFDINGKKLSDYIKSDWVGIVGKQSKYLGVFYLLVVGIPSVIHAWMSGGWHKCDHGNYYHFWTERWADKLSGITRDENGRVILH